MSLLYVRSLQHSSTYIITVCELFSPALWLVVMSLVCVCIFFAELYLRHQFMRIVSSTELCLLTYAEFSTDLIIQVYKVFNILTTEIT